MKAEVNQRFTYELSQHPLFEVVSKDGDVFSVLFDGLPIKVKVLQYNIRDRNFELAIESHIFTVRLEDDLDASIRMVQQKTDSSSGNHVVTAPIPGMIKCLHKQDGDLVLEHDPVLVLEAMKMENTIQAPVKGEKIAYHVQAGERVGKGQPLFTVFLTI